MADLKTTELDALAVRDDADLIMVVDTDDTSMAASGTNKYMTTANFLSGVSGSPAGADTQIQYNDGGAFGGDANLTWDDTNHVITVGASSGGGILVQGTYNSGWTIPNATGTRMFFNPRKVAFRAGYTNSTQWDAVNVGVYSTAFGQSTKASGTVSTAFGRDTTASGYASTAFGYDTTASSHNSTAFGYSTTASGNYSTAFGRDTTASDYASTAFGYGTTASQYTSTAFGYYTTASGNTSTAFGCYSDAYTFGQVAQANYKFSGGYSNPHVGHGECQRSDISVAGDTSDNLLTLLSTDRYVTRYFPILTGKTLLIDCKVLAVANATFEVALWRLTFIVQNNGVITEIVRILNLVNGDAYNAGSDIAPHYDESMGVWKLQIDAEAGELKISGKGESAKTIRWHADLHMTELHNTPQSGYSQ